MNRRQSWASLYWREDCCVILWKQGAESGSPRRRQSRTQTGHRLGQSDDCTVFVARSLCGLWKSSSCLEWLSACSPTSLTSDRLLEVFRSWTISYRTDIPVWSFQPQIYSLGTLGLSEKSCCVASFLENWSPSQLDSWSYLRRLELETRQRLFVAGCEVCVLNHGNRLLGPEACPVLFRW